MQIRLEIAKQRRHIELESLENSYQAELLSLQQTLENDKFLLNHQIHEDIQRKIDELETLKSKTQLCSNILQEMFPHNHQQLISPNKKKKRFDSPESFKENKKQRKMNFFNGSIKTIDKDNLAIFYQLSDMDIIEDWAVIQSSLNESDHDNDDDEDEDDNEDEDDDSEDEDEDTSQLNMNSFKQEQFDYDENRV